MVPGQGEPFTRVGGGPLDHVDPGPVVLDEIHVDGGQVNNLVAQVSRQGVGLQKHLRHDYRRTEIDEDTTAKSGNLPCHEMKVP